MLIILRDPLDENLEIKTEHDDPDRQVTLTILGQSRNLFLKELSNSYGYYGHTINPETTSNLDLTVACHKLPSFKVEKIEPQISVRPLSEGVVS